MKRSHASSLKDRFNANTFQYKLSAAEQRLRVLELRVGTLIARTKCGEFWVKGFYDVSCLLKSVPLSTSEFETARRHLQNSFDYCRLNEFGAATFELRVIRGSLQRL